MKTSAELPVSPAAIETEKAVLGAAVQDKKALARILEAVATEDFTIQAHQVVFGAIRELAKYQFDVTRVTLAERLMSTGELDDIGGLGFLVGLNDEAAVPSAVDSYVRILKDKTQLRRLEAIGFTLVESIRRGGVSSEELADLTRKQLYRSVTSGKNKTVSIGSYADNFPGGYDQLLAPYKKSMGIPTGFPTFDRLTDGFHDSEIFIIGAGPSTGKTSIALQIAEFVASQGKGVLFFSLEMSKRSLFNRLVAHKAQIPVMRFRKGNVNEDERIRLMAATAYLRELPLYLDDDSALTSSDIWMKLEGIRQEAEIGLVIVDYVQLMRPNNKRLSGNDSMTDICEGLQAISKRSPFYTPLLLLSQLTRDNKKTARKPELHDLRGSGSLEAIGNVIAFPWRAELGGGRTDEKSVVELLVRKNRDGQGLREIPMRFVKYLMRFEELEEQGLLSDEEEN